ncbi:MAG TPA: cupredoxin domain-containing protein [Burkholderiales bacterium]|nr:cupredoxin domain-containing protein [Burkholderiales bacterium]
MASAALRLIAVLVLLGACAGARADELSTFTLVAKDGRFAPETLVVPANTRFRLVIRNEGPGPEEFESDSPKKEKVLAPGVSSFLIYAPLPPGRYPFFGEFHPETARGEIVAR